MVVLFDRLILLPLDIEPVLKLLGHMIMSMVEKSF